MPIYRHMNARSSKIGPELAMALVWWCTTLEASMCEVVRLRVSLVLFAAVALPFVFAGTHMEAYRDNASATAV